MEYYDNINERKDIIVKEIYVMNRPIPNEVINKVAKSICKISFKFNDLPSFGTGFFMNFICCKFLITNYHIISEKSMNEIIEIELHNKKKVKLKLNELKINYFKDPIDATVISINNISDIIKDVDFLDYDLNHDYSKYINEDVFTSGYAFGEKIESSSGKIVEIKDNEFSHNIATSYGFSGSPIILLNNIKIIGIHKQANETRKINEGTFIGIIIEKLKNRINESNISHQQNQYFESNKISESKSITSSSLKTSRNKSPPKAIRVSDGKIRRVELDNSGNSYYVTVDEDKIVSDSYISSHLNDYLSNEIEISKSKIVNPQSSKKGNGIRYYGELTKAGRNQDGKTKTDQDTPLVKLNVGDIPLFNMFGVLDGHGQHGHFVSQFCRDHFIKRMTSYAEYCKNNKLITAESIYNELKRTRFAYIKETFNKADEEMTKQTNFDYNFSGTTCNIAFQFNKNLVCASVGDSRGIIIEEKGDSKINIIPLSTDHKPDLPGEIDRIHLNGGIVDKITDYFGEKVGPPRVWKAGTNYPGLAMSRSLGDFQAKSCGVVNVPQIVEYSIQQNTKFMTICSDGVWEFIQNEQVATLGFEFYKKNDVGGFCTDLVKFAVHSWEQFDIIRDDITVVCVYF